MNELNCSTVLDLLPLYVEDMVSPDTRKAVAEHLFNCDACRSRYEQMLAKVPVPVEDNLTKASPLRKFRFHMLLNILGFPLWLPLLATVFAVVLTIYICIWVFDVCVWCIPVSIGAASLASIVAAGSSFAQGLPGNGIIYIGCMAAGAGLAVLSFFPCLWLTKSITRLTVYLWKQISKMFKIKKGNRNND